MENYFNYFTEIEECYQRCRGTRTLLSPLDWALIESWKEANYPLEAVLQGIERCFEKFRTRARKYRTVNSLAYCSQEVLRAAEESGGARSEGKARSEAERAAEVPFATEEILAFLCRNAEAIADASRLAREGAQEVLAADLTVAAAELGVVAAQQREREGVDLQQLESQMAALEEKLTASLTRASSLELLAQFRQEVDRGLVGCRQKMTGPQIESVERQFLKKRLFEHYQIPRLSLFYL